MSILRRSTPNSTHQTDSSPGSSRLSDNALLLWDQVVGDILWWFLPTKSTQKLRNTLVSVYYELIISSHCDELWEPECTIIIYRTISACRNWKLRGPIGPRVDGWKSYCKVLALPAHEFRVEVRVFNWGLLGELWYIISTTNIWVSVLGYVKNNIIQIFFFVCYMKEILLPLVVLHFIV